MALIDMSWTQISVHNVVSEYLRGEREKFSFHPPWLPIVDNPDLNDPLENHKRLRLLYLIRGTFMIEIPPDTTWWNVRSLTENELGELHVSARHNPQWDVDSNKLESVAAIVREPLTSSPDTWAGRIILWGHNRKGPFSILEGSHRMLAYVYAAPRPALNIEVYVGLSDLHCFWHYADPPHALGTDLYKTTLEIVPVNDWLLNRSTV